MGQAKERGTLEERAANPKGDSWNTWNEKYWTPERLERFKRELSIDMSQQFAAIKSQLFNTTTPKKKRYRKVRTGG